MPASGASSLSNGHRGLITVTSGALGGPHGDENARGKDFVELARCKSRFPAPTAAASSRSCALGNGTSCKVRREGLAAIHAFWSRLLLLSHVCCDESLLWLETRAQRVTLRGEIGHERHNAHDFLPANSTRRCARRCSLITGILTIT
jgi:hypothetical protein